MKKKSTKKLMVLDNFTWGTLGKLERHLIHKIATKAIERNIKSSKDYGTKAVLKDHGFINLVMDLEVCHVKHYKLRLKEMAETKDNFSFMHDISMIVNSINRETHGWDTIGMPRFSR